jgi:glycosyltransferase involved in cell wall biosynthesis
MYECDALPEGWADYCNWKADMVIVPCEHNARVFYEKGVRKPIYVVNGGTCPTEFPILPERKTDRPYTFLALGDRGSRKGMDIVWSAFWKAFENSDDVRLIIKARPDSIKDIDLTNSDKRVSIWRDDVQSMADVYSQIDCFVFPSRGEGWGMPPREAAMMGLPVIATRYSGLEVGIDNWAIPIDKYTMRPAMLPVKGDWAHPDVEEVKEKMLWCYDHQSEAKALGLRAAQWLRDNQTWDHAAKQLLDLLDRYA